MRIHLVMAALTAPALVGGCAEAVELAPASLTSAASGFSVTAGTGAASSTGVYAGTSTGGSGGVSVAGSGGGGGGTSPGFDASSADAYVDSAPLLDAPFFEAATVDTRGDVTAAEAGPLPRDIVLLYKCTDTIPADAQIGPSYRLVDMGTSTVNLADVKIRYYFTNEAKVPLLSDFLYAEVNGGPGYRDISSSSAVAVAPFTPPRPGADSYVDITFSVAAGTLTSGQTFTLNFTVHTPGYATNLNESDDHSHDLSKTDFGPNDKVTLYYKDQLALGVEP
jgi:cellulose binding protein with CBM3 domain